MLRLVVALSLLGTVLSDPPVSRSQEEIQKYQEFLDSTRSDLGVSPLRANPQKKIKGNIWQNSGKYQGDILLDDEQVESMVEKFSQGRNANISPNTLWPSGVVVYEFGNGHFDSAQTNHILYTMSVIQDYTCIRFRPRQNNEANYVLITGNSDGCYASVGYSKSRGVHKMNVARDVPGRGCLNPVAIIHEWLHVIGFFHMQSTHNRDEYVRINWANIVEGMEYNFDRYEANLVSNLGLEYEYDSCMHYDAYAFTTNGKTTMDALKSHTGVMGQMSYVTGHDFWRVDRLYGCSPITRSKSYKPFYFNGTVPDMSKRDFP